MKKFILCLIVALLPVTSAMANIYKSEYMSTFGLTKSELKEAVHKKIDRSFQVEPETCSDQTMECMLKQEIYLVKLENAQLRKENHLLEFQLSVMKIDEYKDNAYLAIGIDCFKNLKPTTDIVRSMICTATDNLIDRHFEAIAKM